MPLRLLPRHHLPFYVHSIAVWRWERRLTSFYKEREIVACWLTSGRSEMCVESTHILYALREWPCLGIDGLNDS